MYTSSYDMCMRRYIQNYFMEDFAMAKKESNFNPSSVSGSQDYGLFQINIRNFNSLAGEIGLTYDQLCQYIYDPYISTDCAIRILLRYSDPSKYTTTDWHQVLMRYNKGPAGAQKLFDQGIYTIDYSEKIIGFAQDLYGLTDSSFKAN